MIEHPFVHVESERVPTEQRYNLDPLLSPRDAVSNLSTTFMSGLAFVTVFNFLSGKY
jgi:hypothetical protein